MSTWQEPAIVINGTLLTAAQAMTVRVAIQSFATELAETDALGADETGREIASAYRDAIGVINRLIHATPTHREAG
jgi:hypothetical protein